MVTQHNILVRIKTIERNIRILLLKHLQTNAHVMKTYFGFFFALLIFFSLFYLIVNNEYKSMVFTILWGRLPYSNGRKVNILKCECTYGSSMIETIKSFHSTNFEGSKSTKNNLKGKMGLQCISYCTRMCGKGKWSKPTKNN